MSFPLAFYGSAAAPAPPGGDPNFSSVTSLMDLSAGTLVDVKGNTLSLNNGAAVSLSDPDFPEGCITLDGTNDFVSGSNLSFSDLNTGDFTIEGSFKTSVTTGVQMVLSRSQVQGPGETADDYQYAVFFSAGTLYAQVYSGSVSGTLIASVGGMADGNRHDYAVERGGSDFRFYVDGILIGSISNGFTLNNIGSYYVGVSEYGYFLAGSVGPVRITKGVGRYGGSNYTPAPFPLF